MVKSTAMRTLRLMTILFALILSGCTFFIQKANKTEIIEVPGPSIEEFSTNEPMNMDSVVYMVVENSASYPGGQEALFEYLSKDIKYPQEALDQKIEGTVYVEFIVEKDGSLSNVKIRFSQTPSLESEAIRVVKGMSAWNPGTQRGKAVRSIFILPVTFKL